MPKEWRTRSFMTEGSSPWLRPTKWKSQIGRWRQPSKLWPPQDMFLPKHLAPSAILVVRVSDDLDEHGFDLRCARS